LLSLPENYKVIFLGGGASLQFSMVPMNLLPSDGSADYIVTGTWSKKAVAEAKKVGGVNVAASTESENFSRLPKQDELKLDPKAAYVHFTSNNTIAGTGYLTEPDVGEAPLICDASSDILSRPLDMAKYGLIYAGAQKNIGPAGVTLVIVRNDMLERVPAGLPSMLDYKLQAEKGSLYNTPPVFPIYMVGLVLEHLLRTGGLTAVEKANTEKAQLLYDAIDGSGGYYRGAAEKASRSRMNITFRLPSEDLEAKFVKEATAQKFNGLKGHRSVGGIRASIYNAFPKEGVEALIAFMQDFQQKNG
jgi:phosphoserine aminotransferase